MVGNDKKILNELKFSLAAFWLLISSRNRTVNSTRYVSMCLSSTTFRNAMNASNDGLSAMCSPIEGP